MSQNDGKTTLLYRIEYFINEYDDFKSLKLAHALIKIRFNYLRNPCIIGRQKNKCYIFALRFFQKQLFYINSTVLLTNAVILNRVYSPEKLEKVFHLFLKTFKIPVVFIVLIGPQQEITQNQLIN